MCVSSGIVLSQPNNNKSMSKQEKFLAHFREHIALHWAAYFVHKVVGYPDNNKSRFDHRYVVNLPGNSQCGLIEPI